MDDYDNRVIDFGARLRTRNARAESDLVSERIRNLAFQATKLPNTLSKSEIEELGLAVLMHIKQHSWMI